MSSNEHASGHEWGFVEGMSDEAGAGGTAETTSPTTADAPGGSDDDRSHVTAFAVEGGYLFAQQFTDDAVLDELAPYYNRRRRRFEVGERDFGVVERTLGRAGFDVFVVTDPAAFAVVVPSDEPHPEVLFTDAVFDVSVAEMNVFVLASEAAVREAVDGGATPLTGTPLRLSLSAQVGVGPVTVGDVGSA